ncbi:phospho-N-acetylmuramoyl-pentapeptide-transferase [Egibacter rhizosphaerae]|uniref:Phospho-N-acetylmuramoyl-pentapeptide-transferase n=1 Tax=Egibacter rhizosphaerae TaxID=1670831 RepID=A0A411YAA2_9ACTN|nr:phospho-N-acetylmuramoyl-pentapeptide-transferase [Egibacter rhizosphaerae]QBI18134.1 phospho-N-acetylmuramoyl-pentapeptide-transferase [Egibacter rhizosphaerae]
MIAILVAGGLALVLSLLGTPLVIRFFRARGYGQYIRDDGPQAHHSKRGTPTMGGTALIISAVIAYLVAAHGFGPGLSAGGLLTIGAFAGMGAVGFIDDYIKLRRNRNLGLSSTAKFVGQALVAVGFALGAEWVADSSTRLSVIGQTGLEFGIFFVVWIFVVLAATSNAVNLTDGLDGLAAGTSAFIFAAFAFIAYWIFRNGEGEMLNGELAYTGLYSLEAWLHADSVAIAAAAACGAALGFLWWNAPPAQIFMGDTGSLAIGGGLAAMAVLTETEVLLIVLAGLYVLETLSVIVQVGSYKLTGKRVFRMAPLHHHFELLGWQETTVIVRFWMIGGLFVAIGIGWFYTDYLGRLGLL